MATYKKKVDLFETEAGHEIKRLLQDMSKDMMYNTDASYSADADMYPDHQIPFVNKEMTDRFYSQVTCT